MDALSGIWQALQTFNYRFFLKSFVNLLPLLIPLKGYSMHLLPRTGVSVIKLFCAVKLQIRTKNNIFLKNGHFPATFSLFSSFHYRWQYTNILHKCLLTTRFEPQISGIWWDCSTNWATTTGIQRTKFYETLSTLGELLKYWQIGIRDNNFKQSISLFFYKELPRIRHHTQPDG